jgi:hypothetical protein
MAFEKTAAETGSFFWLGREKGEFLVSAYSGKAN